MFIYFDRNGVLQEVINDKSARLGDLNANEIYVYVDEVELDDIWLTLKRPDGTLSVEKSFIANKVVREIPYDPKRDMKFFKDYKEYEFYKFTISDEITIEGVYQATIRMTYEDTLSALGVLVFKAETGVIKSDQNITQAQYDYLIWYVGSWQGQIGDLEETMGVAQADILDLQNRMNVAEQDINKIEDGTTVVSKALKDDLGNTIKSTYANKLDLVYSSSNNRIAITLKSYDGNTIDADLIDLPKATTSVDGLLAKEDKVKINNIASDIASMGATKQSLSEKNQTNGYAGLDGNAKIPSILLPDSVLGQLEYKGTFTPTAYPSSPEKGWFYISIGNGTIGGADYKVGDWAVFNGTTWDKVDNTDAVMSVNGKLGVVVLNGTDIKVGNGDTWTIEQRIVNIYAELNNRYTKAQTYSQTEIEQRLTDLLGMANLQDILIGSYTDGQTVLASDLSAYNFVIALGKDVNNTYTGTFKPSEIVSGNVISLSPTVYLTRGATDFTITTPTSVKLWGIKLDGITANEISYDGTISGLSSTNVKTAIDELSSEKADKLLLSNLVSNGDFLVAKPSPNQNEPLGFIYTNTTDITLSGGIAKFTSTAEFGRIQYSIAFPLNHKIYYFANVKATSPLVALVGVMNSSQAFAYHSGSNIFEFVSNLQTANGTFNSVQITDRRTSDFTPIEVDYMGAINLTQAFGAGKEPTKEQMDRIIQAKGFFQTTDITIKDLFNDKADKLVLTNIISNGDLLTPKASPNENQALGFTYINTTDITLISGISKFTATAQYGRLAYDFVGNTNDKMYVFSRYKTDSINVRLTIPDLTTTNFHTGSNSFEFVSAVYTLATSRQLQISDLRSSSWTPIEVDYMGVINLTATFGAGNEPTKEQMDAIIKLKGFFQTTTIDLKDLMLLGFTQETRMTPTLTNATTTFLTYRKDDLGYVDIAGNLTITTFGTNLTLPVGYRPLTTLRIPVVSSTGTFGYVIINTNGTIVSNANATIFINTRFATI